MQEPPSDNRLAHSASENYDENPCFLAMPGKDSCMGAIVCKLDLNKKVARRGYIAKLAADSNYRKRNIGFSLAKTAIEVMGEGNNVDRGLRTTRGDMDNEIPREMILIIHQTRAA